LAGGARCPLRGVTTSVATPVVRLDSYESPDAEMLLLSGRQRYSERGQRLLITEAVAAAVFIVSDRVCPVGPLPAFAESCLDRRCLSGRAARAVPGWERVDPPTQLVVPLFMLPTPLCR
jgi:hypothetical protein